MCRQPKSHSWCCEEYRDSRLCMYSCKHIPGGQAVMLAFTGDRTTCVVPVFSCACVQKSFSMVEAAFADYLLSTPDNCD